MREANKRLKATLSHIASENYQLKKVQDLEKEFNSLKNSSIPPSDLIPKIKNMLKSTLTSNQVDLIIGEKKRVRWTNEEVSRALTLRYFGKRHTIA